MKERVVRIGKPTPLIGLVSEPTNFDSEAPAIIILNSGIMHHAGACRLSVKLARAFCEAGFMSLRFDFSGIGDSSPRAGGLSFTESAPLEVKEVMDYLTKKRGISKFILYGLCSGADASYETAKVDDRIIGICQIDAYCYQNWRWYLNHYGPRILQLDVWLRFFKRLLGSSSAEKTNDESSDDSSDDHIEIPSYVRIFPPQQEVAAGLKILIDKDIAMYNIFTGGQMDILNYQEQYKDSFSSLDFKHLLKVDFYPEAGHILSEPHYQKKVVKDITHWVEALAKSV